MIVETDVIETSNKEKKKIIQKSSFRKSKV